MEKHTVPIAEHDEVSKENRTGFFIHRWVCVQCAAETECLEIKRCVLNAELSGRRVTATSVRRKRQIRLKRRVNITAKDTKNMSNREYVPSVAGAKLKKEKRGAIYVPIKI